MQHTMYLQCVDHDDRCRGSVFTRTVGGQTATICTQHWADRKRLELEAAGMEVTQ